jgi:hypothetical protein
MAVSCDNMAVNCDNMAVSCDNRVSKYKHIRT